MAKVKKRILAIDYGLARIGLALSDESQMIASPLATMKAEKQSEKTVKKLLTEIIRHQKELQYELEEIVVGLPLLLSGKTGLLADEVHHFVALLKKEIPVPIYTWDERLTSVQADRAMRESGSMSRKKRAQSVDSVASVILLQSYLDHKSLKKENREGI